MSLFIGRDFSRTIVCGQGLAGSALAKEISTILLFGVVGPTDLSHREECSSWDCDISNLEE